MKNKNYNESLDQLEKAYLNDKSNLIKKFKYAKALLMSRLNDQKKGEEFMYQLLDTESHNYALLELAVYEKKRNNMNIALDYLDELLSTASTCDDRYCALTEMSKIYLIDHKYTEAKNILDTIVCELSHENNLCGSKLKNLNYAKFELAKLEIISKNYDVAYNMLIELTTTKSKYYAFLELGKLCILKNKFGKARKYFKLIYNYSKNPKDKMFALNELGDLETICEEYELASNYYEKLFNEGNISDKECALMGMAKLKTFQKDFDGAKEYLDKIDNMLLDSKNNSYFRMLLYIKSGQYKNAIEELNNIIKLYEKLDIKGVIYLCNLLNIGLKDVKKISYTDSYFTNQILDYDCFVALEYILDIKDKFNPNIDIYKLFNTIKNSLIDEYKIYKLSLYDIYIIPYENIGNEREKYLKVLTLPNSKDILYMYPVVKKYNIDLEENKLNCMNKTKIKSKR